MRAFFVVLPNYKFVAYNTDGYARSKPYGAGQMLPGGFTLHFAVPRVIPSSLKVIKFRLLTALCSLSFYVSQLPIIITALNFTINKISRQRKPLEFTVGIAGTPIELAIRSIY